MAAIAWKTSRLFMLHKANFARNRLMIVVKTFAINAAIIGCYLAERFFFG